MTWLAGGATEGLEEGIGALIENTLINPTLRSWDPDTRTGQQKFEDGLYDMLVGGVSGLMGVTNLGAYRTGQNAKSAAAAPQTAQEAVRTSGRADAASGAEGAQTGSQSAPLRVGRATTIQRPYQGTRPVQAQKNAAPVQVAAASVQQARNRIEGARALAADPMSAGQGFKSLLKNSLKDVFQAKKGVAVDGVTFEGQPYLVDINHSTLGKIISGADLSAERLSLIDTLADIVRNGKYVGSGEYTAHGSKKKPVSRYDYFETPVIIDGQNYIARFDVEALPDVNNFRTHQIAKIDLIQPEGRLARKSHAPASGQTGPAEGTRPLSLYDTISQPSDSVKPSGAGGIGAAGLEAAPQEGTVVNENGLTALTPLERKNLSSGKRNKVVSTFHEAVRFVQNALQNKQSAERAYLGKIPDRVAQMVKEQTGVDISGFGAILHSDNIRHIMKQHGDPMMEPLRGQIPLTAEYIAAVPEVLSSPDRVYLSPETDSRGRAVLGFEKNIGGRYITMQAVSDGTHSIQTDTIFIRKEKNPQGTESYDAGLSTDPAHNARSVPPQGSSTQFTVPQGAENVNPAGTDGIGAADAGSLNSDYDRLQAQSSRFHPEGANAARPVAVPTEDFQGRNIPKSASTMMGASILDNADVSGLEQMVADGGFSFDTIHDKDALRRAQDTVRAIGFDRALERYVQAARANVATKDNTVLGQVLMGEAARGGNRNALAEICSLYARSSTNAAQAMQAQRMLRQLGPEARLYALQNSVNELSEKYGINIELDQTALENFMNAESEAARQAAESALIQSAAAQLPTSFRAKFDAIRYLAMLGNPRTHMRNILGNAFFQIPASVKNRAGAAAELIAKAAGANVERTKSLTGANPFGSLAKEARADWVNAKPFLEGANTVRGARPRGPLNRRQSPFKTAGCWGKPSAWLRTKTGRFWRRRITFSRSGSTASPWLDTFRQTA